jgi:hypothetical protein
MHFFIILALIIGCCCDPFAIVMSSINLTLSPGELQGTEISGEITQINIVSLNNETFQVNYYARSINNISCEYNGFVEYVAIMNLSTQNNTIEISGFIYDINTLIMVIGFPVGVGIMVLVTLMIYLPIYIKTNRSR